jgi:hypothetical protein
MFVFTPRSCQLASAVALAILTLSGKSWADSTWQGGSGDWFDPNNWSPQIPTSTDNAFITNGGSAQITAGDAVDASLQLGVAAGQSGSLTLNPVTSGTLTTSGTEYVGYGGTGAVSQTGGSNSLTTNQGLLILGYNSGSTGNYALSGGALTSVNIPPEVSTTPIAAEYVGYSGVGNFAQTGGTNACTGFYGILIVGFNSGSVGTYNLSAGALTTNYPVTGGGGSPQGSEYVGYSGTGTFVQSGGSNTCNPTTYPILLGRLNLGVTQGSSGSYFLSGGVLTAQEEIIGLNGAGNFVQSGGTNNSGPLVLAAYAPTSLTTTGSYTLTGGTLIASSTTLGAANFFGTGAGMLTIEGGAATATNVGNDGIISLTSAPGSNTFGNLTVNAPDGHQYTDHGTLNIGIGGPPSSGEFGTLTVNGSILNLFDLSLSFVNGYVPMPGQTYDFISGGNLFPAGQTGPIATFFSVSSPYPVQLNYSPAGVSFTVLPEPSSLGLLAIGMGLLARRRSRR